MRRIVRISVTTTRKLRATGVATDFCRHSAAEAAGEAPRIEELLELAGREFRELLSPRDANPEGEKR